MGEEAGEVASCSSAPEPPDRKDFERSLKEICQKIKNISDEIMENRQKSNLKDERAFFQAELDSIKKKLDIGKPKLEKLKNDIREKESTLKEMENDVIFKDERKLKMCLEKAEEEYKRRSLISLRESQVLAKRLNILSQNFKMLRKYNIISEEKRALIEMEHDEKDHQKTLFKSKRLTSYKLLDIRSRTDFYKRAIDRLRSPLQELLSAKNKLIKDYERRVEAYSSWMMKKKKTMGHLQSLGGSKVQTCPETFPLSYHRQRRRIRDEEEPLEPFFEYKTACRRLISYLESLSAQIEDSENNSSNENASFSGRNNEFLDSGDDGDDSSEEFPSSFIMLRSYSSLPAAPYSVNQSSKSMSVLPALKKKFNKRSCKKPAQRINHMLCFIRLFNEIHVPIPVDYQHVGKALEEVKLRLEACQEKTNIIVWDDSDYKKMAIPSLSSADSYWNGSADMSEVSSVGGGSVTQCSLSNKNTNSYCQSSTAETEIGTVANCITDVSSCTSRMGFANKES